MDIQQTLTVPALRLAPEQRVPIPRNDTEVVALIKAVAQRNQQRLPVDRYDDVLRHYLSNPLRFLKFVYFHPDPAYQALRLPLPRTHGLLAKVSAMTRSRFISRFLPPDIRETHIVEPLVPNTPVRAYDPVTASGINDENIEAAFMQAWHEQSPELWDSCIHYVNSHPTAGITLVRCPNETLSLRIEGGTVPAGIAQALQRLGPQISRVSFSQTSASIKPLRRPIDLYSIAQKVHHVWSGLEGLLFVGVELCAAGYLFWRIQSIVQTVFSSLITLRAVAFSALSLGYWIYRGQSLQMTLNPLNVSQEIFSQSAYIPQKSALDSLHEGWVLLSSNLSSSLSSAYHVWLPTLTDAAMKTGFSYWVVSPLTRFIFRKTILERPGLWEDRLANGVDRVSSWLWPIHSRAPHPLIDRLPPTLRELDLSKASDLQDHHLLAISNSCPELQKLTIGNRAQLTTHGWRLLARFPHLTQLQISIENGEGFGTLHRLQLKSVLGDRPGLHIDLRCEAPTFIHSLQFLDQLPTGAKLSARIKKAHRSPGVSHFLARTQNLTSLRLEGWWDLTDSHCEQIATRHPHLRELRATPIGIRGGMMTLADHCHQLETLVLEGVVEGVDELVRKNPGLRVVRLMRGSPSAMSRLKQLPQLQELMLHSGHEITDAHIHQLLAAKPGLDLTIGELSEVTPATYQRVADASSNKRQTQARRLERGVRSTVERTLQVYDRRRVVPLLQLGFALLIQNPHLYPLDPSLLGLSQTDRNQPTKITTAQLSLLAQLLPAHSYQDLRKRLSVVAEEYLSLLKDPTTILVEDFGDEDFGDFGALWGRSLQRPILKSLLQETPILQSSYSQYLQENHPRLDPAILDEWYGELRTGIKAVLDLHKESTQQLGSISLSLPPWGNKVFEVFQKAEFAQPFQRFFEHIRTYADQHQWSDQERCAAALYALFQRADWLQEYLD